MEDLLMQTSLTDEHVEQKRAIANRVKTIVAIALRAVIIVSFFFLTFGLYFEIHPIR